MTSSGRSSGNNRRGFDGDARFTFLLSILTGILTLGLTHILVFYKARKLAMHCPTRYVGFFAIAVPGHQLENGKLSEDFQCRLDRAVYLYRESTSVAIRVLGGCPQGGVSEASVGYAYLLEQGVPSSIISIEETSTNTLENMQHSRDWFNQFEEVVLVTNRYHLLRLQTLAYGLGLKVKVCASEAIPVVHYKKLFVESFFLHWYWTGRIYATFMQNQRMLDKIS